MAAQLSIGIPDLRSAVDRALRITEELLGAEIVVASDFYWHVPIEVAFDVAEEPGSSRSVR